MKYKRKAPDGYIVLQPGDEIRIGDFGTSTLNKMRISPHSKNWENGYLSAAELISCGKPVLKGVLFWIRRNDA